MVIGRVHWQDGPSGMWLVGAGGSSLCGVPHESFRQSHKPDIHVGPTGDVLFLRFWDLHAYGF
jgi:hypothetical protein